MCKNVVHVFSKPPIHVYSGVLLFRGSPTDVSNSFTVLTCTYMITVHDSDIFGMMFDTEHRHFVSPYRNLCYDVSSRGYTTRSGVRAIPDV